MQMDLSFITMTYKIHDPSSHGFMKRIFLGMEHFFSWEKFSMERFSPQGKLMFS